MAEGYTLMLLCYESFSTSHCCKKKLFFQISGNYNINYNNDCFNFTGIVGTHRFCSARDLGDQCQDLSYPDHDRLYRACVYSCTRDDCNSAPLRETSIISIMFSLFGLVLMKLYI